MSAVTYHVDDLWVNGFCDHIPVVGDIFYHLTQCSSLYFLPLQVTQWVRNKVKEDTTLTKLLDEKLLLIRRRNI